MDKEKSSQDKTTPQNDKPFVRRRPGGASTTTAKPSSVSLPSRRPFRVASRRRPFTPSTTSTTTTTTTTQATTQALESEESLQDIGDTEAFEEPSQLARSKTTNVQYRRPLTQLKVDADQNPSATNDDKTDRQSKKYSASFKQNQLEETLKVRTSAEEIDGTTEGRTAADDYSSDTAVALAAHQLLSAPVPIVPDYDEPTTRKPKTTQTIVDYKYTSPYYTEDYKTQFTEDYFRTNPTRLSTQGFLETSTPYYQSDSPSTYFVDTTRYTTESDKRTTYTNIPEAFTKSRTYNTLRPVSAVSVTVGSEGESTAKYTYETFPSTTYNDFENRVSRPRFSNTNPTVTAPSTFSSEVYPSTVANKFSRPAGFSPNLVSLGFEPESTLRLGPSTARYFGSSAKIPTTIDVTTEAGSSQEPSYFTREYLLESPVTKSYDDEYQYLSPITSPQTTTTRKPPRRKTIFRRVSSTAKPTSVIVPETTKPRRTTRKPFEKIPTIDNAKESTQTVNVPKADPEKNRIKPLSEYDYYDDSQEKMGVKYEKENKVILDGKGNIECLDIGNFAHPTSCKKFISCARIRGGSVLGWEYICPKGLSFDPVGGICNWSAGLGCQEKDI